MASAPTRSGVLCAGAMCVDIVTQTDRWPEEEGLAHILGTERQGGASTFNMAVDLRRLGFEEPVSVMALLGRDELADFIEAALVANGVDVSRVQRAPDAQTSYTQVVSSRETGKRTFFYSPGTNHAVGPEHFDFTTVSARLVHFGMPGVHARLDAPGPEGGEILWVEVFRRARAAGLLTNVELVSISPEKIGAVGRPLLPHLDYLIVNDVEIGGLTGLTTVRAGRTDIAAVVEAARRVAKLGPLQVVAVHFPEGCVAVTADGSLVSRPSVRVPSSEVRGTNGAGDAFAAGLLFAILGGWPLDEGLALAHASAAASLRSLDTIGAVVPWREALDLAAGWGWRDPLVLPA